MLTIKDLTRNEALDKAAMRAVRGGMRQPGLPSTLSSVVNPSPTDADLHKVIQGHMLGGFGPIFPDQRY